MKETLYLKTNDEIRTMTDPYRLDILRIFNKFENEPMTVKDVAEHLNEPHGKVYYHIKKLIKVGALALDHTKQYNGITAKYYRIDFKNLNFEESETDPSVTKELISNQTSTMLSKLFDETKKDMVTYMNYIDEYEKTLDDMELSEEEIRYMKDLQLSLGNMNFTPQTYKTFKSELEELMDKYKEAPNQDSEMDKRPTFSKEIMIAIYSDVDKIKKSQG